MAVDATVLRVFANADGAFGNPLGVVDAAAVDPSHRQRIATDLGYSETIFIDVPHAGVNTAQACIFTPTTELPFAGHPTVGASWWLRHIGRPIHTLQVPAGDVEVTYDGDMAAVRAKAGWAPEFAIYDVNSMEELLAAEPGEYPDDDKNYLWTWIDEDNGVLRSRMFAAGLGIPEDEATGAAAVRITDRLGRDLTIVQGKGSVIHTRWSVDGWVRVAGRVVADGSRQID